eukprot:7173879-Pyramimonas_sp.AAC.2
MNSTYSYGSSCANDRKGALNTPDKHILVSKHHTGIFSLPCCDWCPLRVYSLSPVAIGARCGYIHCGYVLASYSYTSPPPRPVIRHVTSALPRNQTRHLRLAP